MEVLWPSGEMISLSLQNPLFIFQVSHKKAYTFGLIGVNEFYVREAEPFLVCSVAIRWEAGRSPVE